MTTTRRSDLPLLVQNGARVRALAAGRTLSSIGALAVREPKKQALEFSATLPHAGKGQAVSLRVRATDSGGGVIDQPIIRAYFGA